MSYSIVFETKIVDLPDGRILHLSRSGCNNDNCGRTKSDFEGKIYTKEQWEKYIKHFEDIPKTGNWEMKIGSRYCEISDYGKHLRRMTNKSCIWLSLKDKYLCYAKAIKGITQTIDGVSTYYDSRKEVTPNVKEMNFYLMGSYKYDVEYLYDIDEIIKFMETHDGCITFNISKKYEFLKA